MFNLKPDVTNDLMHELQMAPSAQAYAEKALVKTQATQEKINFCMVRRGYIAKGSKILLLLQAHALG